MKVTAIEGDPPQRATVQVWDSMEQLQAWRADPEFQAIRKIGGQYATFRAFAIEGMVQKGRQLGRKLGFPTANVALGEYVAPKFGVGVPERVAHSPTKIFGPVRGASS